MKLIFIFKEMDSCLLIKSLYDIACWIRKNKDSQVIFYLPSEFADYFSAGGKLEIKWFDNLEIATIPEADIIISTDHLILKKLSSLNRGELVYLTENKEDVRFKTLNLGRLGLGISDNFFIKEENKRDKVIIGGGFNEKETLQKVIQALEISSLSPSSMKILILDSQEEYLLNSSFEYSYIYSKEVDFISIFKDVFFLIWHDENNYPIIPLWAMAAGVVVINIRPYRDQIFSQELMDLKPQELALKLIKIYKMGNYRRKIISHSIKKARDYRLEKISLKWSNKLEDILSSSKKQDIHTEETNIANVSKKGIDSHTITTEDTEDYIVDLVVVNYNTIEYLKRCITSIKKFTEFFYHLIIVDNGSNDGSKKYLQENLQNEKGVTIIQNKENQGYARACNQGILRGTGQYIILLNSDIEVTSGWLKPLLEIAEKEDVAIVGPKLVNKDEEIVGAGVVVLDGSYKSRGWKEKDGPGVLTDTEDVLSVGGACYLLKRELLHVLGLFDEEYFFYFEELDYSLRAREKGYRVVYCPESRIYHYCEGALENGDDFRRLKRNQYFITSKKRFHSKWREVIAGSERRREPKQIVVAGLIPWDFRFQRPQQMVKNLVRIGYEVLYLNPVCKNINNTNTLPNQQGDSMTTNTKNNNHYHLNDNDYYQKVDESIYVYSPTGYGTIMYNLLKGNGLVLGRGIADLIKELDFENYITIINAPYWFPLLKYLEYSLLVYDCMDNYFQFKDLARHQDWLQECENQVLSLADIVMAASNGLYQHYHDLNPNTYLINNGVDIEHFTINYKPEREPDDIPPYETIIGYYGAISSWFDTELVTKVAREYPEVGILLIGEVSTDIGDLNKLSNVFLIGERPYKDIPDYLYYFDLAIIPFKINELTIVSDPVKLYEYLAAGKKVLATDLPEIRKFSQLIEIGETEKEYINKIADLLKDVDNEEIIKKRYKAMETESWYYRAQKLNDLLHHGYYDLFMSEGDKEEIKVDITQNKIEVKEGRDNKSWFDKIKEFLK